MPYHSYPGVGSNTTSAHPIFFIVVDRVDTPRPTALDTPAKGGRTSPGDVYATPSVSRTLFKSQLSSLKKNTQELESMVAEGLTYTVLVASVDGDAKWQCHGKLQVRGNVMGLKQTLDCSVLLIDGVVTPIAYMGKVKPGVMQQISNLGRAQPTSQLVTGDKLGPLVAGEKIIQIESHGQYLVGKGTPNVAGMVCMVRLKEILSCWLFGSRYD